MKEPIPTFVINVDLMIKEAEEESKRYKKMRRR